MDPADWDIPENIWIELEEITQEVRHQILKTGYFGYGLTMFSIFPIWGLVDPSFKKAMISEYYPVWQARRNSRVCIFLLFTSKQITISLLIHFIH